jgi:hypothetical protein
MRASKTCLKKISKKFFADNILIVIHIKTVRKKIPKKHFCDCDFIVNLATNLQRENTDNGQLCTSNMGQLFTIYQEQYQRDQLQDMVCADSALEGGGLYPYRTSGVGIRL